MVLIFNEKWHLSVRFYIKLVRYKYMFNKRKKMKGSISLKCLKSFYSGAEMKKNDRNGPLPNKDENSPI